MTTPLGTRLLATLLLALACVAGCAPPSEEPTEEFGATTESVVVSLALRGDKLEPLALRRGDGEVAQPPTRGRTLRWELRDTDGGLQASGEVEDPRQLRAESEHGDHEHDAVADVAMLTLSLPKVAHSLRLLETTDAGYRLLAETRLPRLADSESSQSALVDASKDLVGSPVLIAGSSQNAGSINLLVVGDGYSKGELAKFRTDAKQLSDRLVAADGFARHASQIRIHRQDVASTQSGIGDPSIGKDPVTAFEMSFGNDSSRPRRCVMFEPSVGAAALSAIRSRSEAVGADAVIILANSNEYGGCASPWTGVVTVTRHASSAKILAHELGHTLFRLADEYDGNQCGVYQGGPNVATKTSKLPWKSMLTTQVLPTPLSAAAGTIGAFQGANHCTQKAYRPSKTCMMRSLDAPFCAVCSAEIDRIFELRGAGETGAIQISNKTGAGLFVRCPASEGPACSGWTYLGPGTKKTLQTNAAGYGLIIDNSTIDDATTDFQWLAITPRAAAAKVFANSEDPLQAP